MACKPSSGTETWKAPQIRVRISLTGDTYSHQAPDSEKPHLVATTTLLSPEVLTVEAFGQWDSGSVLDKTVGLRGEHLTWTDVKTGEEVVNLDPFPGTCNSHSEIDQQGIVELRQNEAQTTHFMLHDVNPLCDPVRDLKSGHEYRVRLKPQTVRAWCMSIRDLLGDKKHREREEAPKPSMITLASEDELLLKVVE